MYHRLLNICRSSVCRTPNKLEIARRLCQKTNIDAKQDNITGSPTIKSETFPDYKVVYVLRFGNIVRIVNGLKAKMCAVTLVSMPISSALYYTGILAANDALGSVALFAMYTLSTFAIGLYTNNTIVYVYLKEDEKKVIITYVDFWGKRVDVHTTISSIPQFVDMASSFNDGLYKRFKVDSHDQTLKLSLLFAQHMEKNGMEVIFGKPPV